MPQTNQAPFDKELQEILRRAMIGNLPDPKRLPIPPVATNPALTDPAVAYCTQAYTHALTSPRSQNLGAFEIKLDASAAYCEAMPPLIGQKNIRAFIACVSYGMLIKTIDASEGAKLLYAAQIAANAHKARPHRRVNEVHPKSTQSAPESPAEVSQDQ